MHVCVHACLVASVVSDSLQYGLWTTAHLLCLWDSLDKNTELGGQATFPTQGLNQVSCVFCTTGRFFAAEPPEKLLDCMAVLFLVLLFF